MPVAAVVRSSFVRRAAVLVGTVALLLSSAGLVEAHGAPRWLTRLYRVATGQPALLTTADTVVVYGPKLFALGSMSTSGTFVERLTFATGTPAGTLGQGYVLRVVNGYNGAPAITSGTVKLNGVVIASGSFSTLHAGQTVDLPMQLTRAT